MEDDPQKGGGGTRPLAHPPAFQQSDRQAPSPSGQWSAYFLLNMSICTSESTKQSALSGCQ